MKNAIGGIYCIIPVAPHGHPLYNEKLLDSVHRKIRRVIGVSAKEILNNTQLDARIAGWLLDTVQSYIPFLKAGVEGGENADAIRERFGFAIYHNGVRVRNSLSTNTGSSGGYAKFVQGKANEFFDRNFNGGGELSGYRKSAGSWLVAVANFAPMAARYEATGSYPQDQNRPIYKGLNKMVMIRTVADLAETIYYNLGRKGSPLIYGYILNAQLWPEYQGKRLPVKA